MVFHLFGQSRKSDILENIWMCDGQNVLVILMHHEIFMTDCIHSPPIMNQDKKGV